MKCEKCQKAEATVYYAVISGKFKATRKNYCKACMETEKVRITSPPAQSVSPQSQEPQSLLDVVQGELAKHGSVKTAAKQETTPPAGSHPSATMKNLDQKMKQAIREEKYEEAARIRDEIAAMSKTPPKDEPKSKS